MLVRTAHMQGRGEKTKISPPVWGLDAALLSMVGQRGKYIRQGRREKGPSGSELFFQVSKYGSSDV